MTPEERAREVLTTLADVLHDSRGGDDHCPDGGGSTWCRTTAQDALDALAAAGLRVVSEGHAVIDGEVVALDLNEVVSLRGRLRWDAEITDGFRRARGVVDATPGAAPSEVLIRRARGGAPDTEGRHG